MRQYLDLLADIKTNGTNQGDRTGTGTRKVFGRTMRFKMEDGFPLLTTKALHWKSIVHELLWFILGDTNIKYLNENGVRIWNEWADVDGYVGKNYGHQWRSWETYERDGRIDQLSEAIAEIEANPNSRRMFVTAWNPTHVREMKTTGVGLPPCHLMYQFNVQDGRLHLRFDMRSIDVFLGLPFNIASYGLLLLMVCSLTGLEPGDLIWQGGDCHIYNNHFDQVELQLDRTPRPLPDVFIDRSIMEPENFSIDDFVYSQINLEGYDPYPAIKAKVAV
tara:strand:+ start:18 stop:845 length:828 start_codon:yes stop_codon:yes gene_type:complete